MANRIILKRSSVASKSPVAADLSAGELAINLTDKRLFSKDGSGNIINITLDASHITSGTLPSARLSGSYAIDITGSAASITGTYGGSLTSSQITTALGFTPLSNAGGSLSGSLSGTTATFSQNLSAGTGTAVDPSNVGGFAAGQITEGTTGFSAPGIVIGTGTGQHGAIVYGSGTMYFGTENGSDNTMYTRATLNSGGTFNATNVLVNSYQTLHAGNYTSYSPSLTGSGASGTWGINVTGNAATATTTDNINGRAFFNRDSGNALGQDSYTNNGVGYVNSVSLFGQTDGGIYTSAYSTAWIHQIYGDFRTGQIAIRGKNANTWQAWRVVLDASNYTSYAPSLTGSGASGTWGINITGSAASITGTYGGSLTSSQVTTALGYTPLSNAGGTISGSLTVTNNITVSSANATGGGIILADDGDIVDLNDGYCSMRFSYGVRIYSGNRGGSAAITLSNGGTVTATQFTGSGAGLSSSTVPIASLVAGDYSSKVTSGSYSINITGSAASITGTYGGTLTSSQVTTALGFTPYNSSNPSGYITSSALSSYLPLSGGTLSGALSGTSGTFSGEVKWGANGPHNSGNPRSLAIGWSGGNYGAAGYGITYTSTTGVHNYAINDIVSHWEAYDGITVSAAAAGTVGTQISWTNVLEARRSNSSLKFKGNTVLDSSNYTSYSPSLTGSGASGTWGISISGNAATVGGLSVHSGSNTEANKIVRTDSNGYINAGWINTISGDQGTAAIDRVYASYDQYIRYYTPSNFRTVLDVPTRGGSGASGTWGISISGNAATATSASQLSGISSNRAVLKRRYRIHTADSTSLNSSISAAEMGFTYGGSGEPAGPFIAFGGLAGDIDYSCQLVGQYHSGGNNFVIRTRNDDASSWNAWRTILTDGNYNSYSPTLTGTGASGTWGINITGSSASCTGNAATATTATTATNWGAYGAVPGAGQSFGTANTIGRSDGNGYTYFGYINSSTSNNENGTVSQVIITNGSDNFYRKASISHLTSQVQSNASGTWGINVTGSAGGVAWGNISGRPSWMTVTNLIADLSNFNTSVPSGFYQGYNASNSPTAGTWFNLINVRHSNTANDHGFQLSMSYYSNTLYHRRYSGGSGNNDGSFDSWATVLSSVNYNSYSPTLTGTGASGTWGINITGSSASCTGNAATVSDGVYASTTQTISGAKTFSASTYFTSGYVEVQMANILDGISFKNGSTLVGSIFRANSRLNYNTGSGAPSGFVWNTSSTSNAMMLSDDGSITHASASSSGNAAYVNSTYSGFTGTVLKLAQTASNSGNYYNYNLFKCSDNYAGDVFYVQGNGYVYAQQFYSPSISTPNLQTLGTSLQTSVMWYYTGSYWVYDQSTRFGIASGGSTINCGTNNGVGSTTYFYNTKYVYGSTFFWDSTYLYGYVYFYGSYFYFGSNGFTCDGLASIKNTAYNQYYYGNSSGYVYVDFYNQRQVYFDGLGGDLYFSGGTYNKATGRRLEIIIRAGSSSRNLYFPGWTWASATPTSIAANKVAILYLRCVGYNESDVIADYSVTP